MTPLELAEKLNLKIINEGGQRAVTGVFCCDLLSIVMSKVKLDAAWITVMSNVNTVAVAVMADVSCVIVSEGIAVDNEMVQKASQQGVCLMQSELPTFDLGLNIQRLLDA